MQIDFSRKQNPLERINQIFLLSSAHESLFRPTNVRQIF